MSPQFLYGGSSWAASSYDADMRHAKTNLSKEWNMPCIDLSVPGVSVLKSWREIEKNKNKTLPVIFLYHCPSSNVTDITGISYEQFLTRPDWMEIWNRCNQHCLEQIDSLGRPVLLIGAVSTVPDWSYKNIIIGHANWQLWLAEQAGMQIQDQHVLVSPADGGNYTLNHFWAAESAHRYLHENPGVTPDKTLLDSVWDVYFFWQTLEKANLFHQVHPNFNGNRLFAEYLRPKVEKFINDCK